MARKRLVTTRRSLHVAYRFKMKKEEDIFVYFTFKLTQPQNELQTRM